MHQRHRHRFARRRALLIPRRRPAFAAAARIALHRRPLISTLRRRLNERVSALAPAHRLLRREHLPPPRARRRHRTRVIVKPRVGSVRSLHLLVRLAPLEILTLRAPTPFHAIYRRLKALAILFQAPAPFTVTPTIVPRLRRRAVARARAVERPVRRLIDDFRSKRVRIPLQRLFDRRLSLVRVFVVVLAPRAVARVAVLPAREALAVQLETF